MFAYPLMLDTKQAIFKYLMQFYVMSWIKI